MFPALQSLLNRPGAQAAAQNFGWLAGEKAARLVLNVGVGFWVARYLGPTQFGELSYALAIVGIAMLLAELGLDGLVRRELIREPAGAGALLAVVAVMRMAGALLAWFAVAAWGLLQGGTQQFLLPVLGLTLFQPVLWVSDLWFQACLRARTSVLAQIGALGVGAAGRIWLITRGLPLTGFAVMAVVEMVVAGVLLGILARREGLALRFGPAARRLASGLWRQAWPLLLSGFAVALYLKIDTVMLQAMAGPSEVGVYSAAVRFTEIWYFLPVTLASSVLPSLLRARAVGVDDYRRRLQAFYDLNAGLAYLVAVPLALAAPGVVALAYGSEYAASVPVMQIHVWSGIFVFLGVARGQFLVNEGHVYFYLWSTVAGLVVNVILNGIFIPRWGSLGAAWANLAAQIVAAFISTACHAPLRTTAWMQMRALLIPFRWYRYVRSS